MPARRFILAMVAGAMVTALVTLCTYPYVTAWILEPLARRGPGPLSSSTYATLAQVPTIAILALPGLLAAVLIVAQRHRDPETRCRNCGYILRGIPEPRCPECGERI